MELVKEKEQKNPRDYVYTEENEIKMNGRLFVAVTTAIADALQKETKIYYPEKYDWINKKTQKVVKKPKKEDIEKGDVYKVPAIERILQGEPVIQRTQLGQFLLDVTLQLEQQHLKNIEEGNVTHKDVIEERSKEMKAKLEELKK